MQDRYLRRLDIKLVDGEFENLTNEKIGRPEQVYDVFKSISDENQEKLIALYLSRDLLTKQNSVLSVGSDNTTSVRMKHIFGQAYTTLADYLILIHNHPSGDPEPSPEDKSFLLAVQETATKAAEIHLLDFMIIGKDSYWSMFEVAGGGEYGLGVVRNGI